MIVEIWQLTEENLSFWISLTWFGICRWKEKKILLKSESFRLKSESFSYEKWKFCLKSESDLNFNLVCLGARPSPLDDTHVGRLSRLFSP